MACLIKDYSADVDSARLVHAFWGLACALEIDVWFEFVYSEANVADWPSRGWLSFATELGAEEMTIELAEMINHDADDIKVISEKQ